MCAKRLARQKTHWASCRYERLQCGCAKGSMRRGCPGACSIEETDQALRRLPRREESLQQPDESLRRPDTKLAAVPLLRQLRVRIALLIAATLVPVLCLALYNTYLDQQKEL